MRRTSVQAGTPRSNTAASEFSYKEIRHPRYLGAATQTTIRNLGPLSRDMPDYRRLWHQGGTYFFTVNLLERRGNDLLVRRLDLLKHAVVDTARWRRFRVDAWVVLPEHLHCIATLPPGDSDFASRWRRIKKTFSKQIPVTEHRSAVRQRRGERGIWQRRYWEHLIRDEADYRNHVDYIHYNPVKHRLVQRATDWPHSSLHRHIRRGLLPPDWSAPP